MNYWIDDTKVLCEDCAAQQGYDVSDGEYMHTFEQPCDVCGREPT